jgi:hypothetical protein
LLRFLFFSRSTARPSKEEKKGKQGAQRQPLVSVLVVKIKLKKLVAGGLLFFFFFFLRPAGGGPDRLFPEA